MRSDGGIVTVRVPLILRKRGGRKLVLAPDGTPVAPNLKPGIDSALVKAVGRAFRWRKLIETGACATVEEIAAAERINPSYVSRVFRLTLLAPDIVEAILDGRQAETVTLAALMKPFPLEWEAQRATWSGTSRLAML